MSDKSSSSAGTAAAFERLYTIIARLRAPDGCPWDREQTPVSLRSTLIEEAFETADALSEGDSGHAGEELGDVLLNAVMIAYMYEQDKLFSVREMLDSVSEKLIRRHPHVFADSEGSACVSGTADTAGKVLDQWDAIKQDVEGRVSDSVLDSVPEGFPPLLKAYKLQKKAAKKGFDWNSAAAVSAKVHEELAEVEEAAAAVCKADTKPFTVGCSKAADSAQFHLEEEVGDLIFAVVNWARHMGIDPSVSLSRANNKFARRFRYVEKRMKETDQEMSSANLEVMDRFWDEAKRFEQ